MATMSEIAMRDMPFGAHAPGTPGIPSGPTSHPHLTDIPSGFLDAPRSKGATVDDTNSSIDTDVVIKEWKNDYHRQLKLGHYVFVYRSHDLEDDTDVIVSLFQLNEILRKSYIVAQANMKEGEVFREDGEAIDVGIFQKGIPPPERLIDGYNFFTMSYDPVMNQRIDGLPHTKEQAEELGLHITQEQYDDWLKEISQKMKRRREVLDGYATVLSKEFYQNTTLGGIKNNWNPFGVVKTTNNDASDENMTGVITVSKFAHMFNVIAVEDKLRIGQEWGWILRRRKLNDNRYGQFEVVPYTNQLAEEPSMRERSYFDDAGRVVYGDYMRAGWVDYVPPGETGETRRLNAIGNQTAASKAFEETGSLNMIWVQLAMK